MNLSSVRELKSLLLQDTLPQIPVAMKSTALPGGAVRAFRVAGPAPARPTMALGVAPGRSGQFRLAVRLHERAMEQSRELELVKARAKGEVDVRFVGRLHKLSASWFRQRHRPLRMGPSVGHVDVTAGTLGAFVRPKVGGDLGLLSNNHVLANENRAKRGDSILQPGRYDGGVDPDDVVATLADFVRLQRNRSNLVDAAWATLLEGQEADRSTLRGNGKLQGVGDGFVDEGWEVRKLGRTTGATTGRVTAFELDDVKVGFDLGVLTFDNQIEIEGTGADAFSDGGDSGSLIVDAERRAVALLFAGGDVGGSNGKGLTYANPLLTVLDKLGLELVL